MRYATSKEDRDQFDEFGWVEFEQILPEADEITKMIEWPLSPDQAISTGRDLWRREPLARQVACRRRYADVVVQLTRTKTVRLAYDQVIASGARGVSRLFSPKENLSQLGPFLTPSCGLIIRLTGEDEPTEVDSFRLVPTAKGNGLFFSADHPIDLSLFLDRSPDLFWLIVYTKSLATYVANPGDPHAHTPQALGYASGDHLRDEEFPMIMRR